MFIILIYDIKVESKHQIKILNTCRQYLFHIQDSCFHGYITYKNLNKLKEKLSKIVSLEDHIIIYELSSDKYLKVKELGKSKIKLTTIIE